MSTQSLMQSLEQQIEILALEIEPIAHATAQQARFDVTLFSTKGTRLREYLLEVRTNFAQLRQVVAENRSAQVAYVAERLVSQITALQRELATQTLRTADKQKEVQSSDYYSKLVEHQQYERRLIGMIQDRESKLGKVETFKEQQHIQKELAALEGRLMRCRQALIKIERSIERQERGF
ncbi:primosomal replication protein PriC [Rouxiella sp. WC2420]|uniref:Primosomal replication protein PriC n=1 Tax=Rouxiella sp. WC2420 TaxID=3234145 RepID=A0AB39VNB1_9GAMM